MNDQNATSNNPTNTADCPLSESGSSDSFPKGDAVCLRKMLLMPITTSATPTNAPRGKRSGLNRLDIRDLENEGVIEQFGVKFFFATPYHSWERETNENTNGLIRHYLPKGMCLKNLTQAQCDWIANELNNRPRERLGFGTPAEAFRRPQGGALQS